MRQAGRYMPEYRSVREQVPSVLELCKNPALCADIAIGAAERLGVDAAIIFSDILPIVEPMGMELEFIDGNGPVIHNPVRDSQDVRRVTELESVDALDFVMETVRTTRRSLPQEIPLIGFAAAPFTLASYMVEGGTSRTFVHTKTLMYRDESAWNALMQRLARSIARYPQRADRRGRPSGADLRQLGRNAGRRGLPSLRPAAHQERDRRTAARRARDPLRHREPRAAARAPPRPGAT